MKNDAKDTLRIILGLWRVVRAAEDSAIFSKNDAGDTLRIILGLKTMVRAAEGSAIFLKNDAGVTLRTILGLLRVVRVAEGSAIFGFAHAQSDDAHDFQKTETLSSDGVSHGISKNFFTEVREEHL